MAGIGRERLLLPACVLLAVGVVATAIALHKPEDGVPQQHIAIPRGGAEALLDEAVRLAGVGDIDGMCRSIAASTGMCTRLLHGEDSAPGPVRPTVVGVSRHVDENSNPTLVLHLEGTRADGSPYDSDFAVVRRVDDPTRLASLTAAYWSGVRFRF
ncbi:hypothetical protein [Amycolatopsis palatopharyngis]|uniref:hypothetical protein n=1 Tax=Amycolatopsis palatopharyngis TaxID=187982 RepID=UPI000E260F1C|nr:hypothetical protein [Amycolatopsis palatopharyngis]